MNANSANFVLVVPSVFEKLTKTSEFSSLEIKSYYIWCK